MPENDTELSPNVFDLSDEAWEASILKPGIYDAKVVNSRVNQKSSMTWLAIAYEVMDENGHVRQLDEMSAFDAPDSSPRYYETAKGKGRVRAILKANGKPLAFSSVDQVPAALIGCRVSIVIGSRTQNGLRVPIVDSIRGPASDAAA
jgi:hypothetical protein